MASYESPGAGQGYESGVKSGWQKSPGELLGSKPRELWAKKGQVLEVGGA